MHLVTDVVLRECQEGLRNVDIGILTLCSQHTSAGLTVSFSLSCWFAPLRLDIEGERKLRPVCHRKAQVKTGFL